MRNARASRSFRRPARDRRRYAAVEGKRPVFSGLSRRAIAAPQLGVDPEAAALSIENRIAGPIEGISLIQQSMAKPDSRVLREDELDILRIVILPRDEQNFLDSAGNDELAIA